MSQSDRDVVFDKPMAYEEGDKIIYRASSLGSCPGALVRARLGVSGSAPSDMMQERFDEGTAWEERVLLAGLGVDFTRTVEQDHLALHGEVVQSEAGLQIETELAWSNKVIRCHPDGIATKSTTLEKYVVEVKFLGEQMFNDITMRGVWPANYQWQKAVEMLSTGLPLLYIIGKKVVTEDADGNRVVELGEVWTEEVLESPFSLAEVKMRVLEIEGYVARGEMPACPVPLMYPCPYWADHEPGAGADARVESDDEVLKAWIDVWRRAKEESDKAVEAVDFARKAVLEQMAELKLESARCDGVDLTVIRPTQGNVSWAKAYKALSMQTKQQVNEDEFRGKVGDVTVRIVPVKDDEGKVED